jgi:hypothetical protein
VLENLAEEILYCHERARRALRKAGGATTDQLTADFLAIARGWMVLAHGYEREHKASRHVADFTRMLREQGGAFDPDDIVRLDIAYHAVLHQLGLADIEDAATLIVAKRVIDLAAQGERDPERLTSATVEALSK